MKEEEEDRRKENGREKWVVDTEEKKMEKGTEEMEEKTNSG